jgi:hypothetical protein
MRKRKKKRKMYDVWMCDGTNHAWKLDQNNNYFDLYIYLSDYVGRDQLLEG